MPIPLTVITITKNEAKHIQRCLHSTSFANDQLVIDSESHDQTAALAAQSGARVLINPWPGYGPQKNFALKHSKNDWNLFIDADEEVPPALASDIAATISRPDKDFYWLKIVTVFLGQPLYHLYGHNPRLFCRSAGQWTDTAVHEQVITKTGTLIKLGDNLSRVLPTPLLHHSHSTISSYLKSMHRYTTLDAKTMAHSHHHRSGRPVTPSLLLPYWLAARQFIKLTFYRRGFFDGWAGLVWCTLSAYYEYEMAQKYNRLCA